MDVKLYAMRISHPSQAARKMLELKEIKYQLVDVLPLNQRVHLRLAGFRGGTVPALKIDGRRIQGSRAISRALDQRWPEAPLFPPELRERVQEAECWGEQQLQPVPRRLARFGAATSAELRRWVAENESLPVPGLIARVAAPAVRYYAGVVEADGRRPDEEGVRADLAALPGLLDHVDELLADGTLTVDPPNAASLRILSTVRLLAQFADLHDYVGARPCAAAAHQLFPRYLAALPPFLAPDLFSSPVSR
jgi:glutathione S-transferase